MQDAHLALGLTTPQEYKQFEVLGRYYTTHLRAYNKAFADLVRLKRFQMSQKKDEALLERRAQDAQLRFESQERKAEEHELKMQRLKDRENRKTQAAGQIRPPKPPTATEKLTSAEGTVLYSRPLMPDDTGILSVFTLLFG